MLIIVVPDDCETMDVRSSITMGERFFIPTVVCGGEVKEFISENEILDPSVRSRLLSALGQKELSVKSWAAVCGSETHTQSKTDKPKVLLKDCPFVQRAKVIGEGRPGFQKKSLSFDVLERFPGGFRFRYSDREVCGKVDRESFLIGMKYTFGRYVQKREKFSELLHRGAKHNAVRHIRDWADDIKDELLKVPEEERLEK